MNKNNLVIEYPHFKNEAYSNFSLPKGNKVTQIDKYLIKRVTRTLTVNNPNLTSSDAFVHTGQGFNVSKVASLFNIKSSKVLNFINSSQGLASLMLETKKQIRKWFPTDVLEVEFVYDMPDKLQIAIRSTGDVNQAFERFNEFNEKWWFPCSNEATKHLFIVLNFQD